MIAKDLRRPSTFHATCLRRILKVFWPNRISSNDLLEADKQEPINTVLKRKQSVAIGWSYHGDGTISLFQNSPNMDTRGKRKERAFTQHMEEDDAGKFKEEAGMVWSAAVKKAQDRDDWRNQVEALCATRQEEDE